MESPKTSTLFVRNIPENTDQRTFENIFSEIGPLKRAFLVRSTEHKCKGFGYVTYSTRDDAEKALQAPLLIDGKRLIIKLSRPKKENEKADKDETPKSSVKRETGTKKKIGNKSARLIIRNLSFKCREKDLRKEFEEFGKLDEVAIAKMPDGRMRGFAFIQFAATSAAREAIKEKNASKLLGRPIAIDWSVPKTTYEIHKAASENSSLDKEQGDDSMNNSTSDKNGADFGNNAGKPARKLKTADVESSEGSSSNVEQSDERNDSDMESSSTDASSGMSDDDSESKVKSDTSTIDKSKKRKHQNVENDEGFTDKTVNSTKRLKRVKSSKGSSTNKEQSDDESDQLADDKIDQSSSDDESDVKDERNDSDIDCSGTDASDSESDSDDNSECEIKGDTNISKKAKHKNKRISTDVNEGRTVFVRNLPFDVEEEELQEVFSRYGEVKYCKLCMDKVTEHPKGTGFIQFKAKEEAETCLEMCQEDHKDGGLIIQGRRIYANIAISKNKVKEMDDEKKKNQNTGKDKRNLFLAREGLIRAGTAAAEGVSQTDLTKRMNLELRKRRLLKDLKMYISNTRLGAYNLPPHMNDKQLRKLFVNAAGDKSAQLKEARVMRDLKKLEKGKLGNSKGHGFVEFTEHRHALQALRHLNNNPTIFSDTKRPIVEFSVENGTVKQIREKRLQKSLEKNRNSNTPKQSKNKKKKSSANLVSTEDCASAVNVEKQQYAGMTTSKNAMSKGQKVLPSHLGPKIRHKKRPKVMPKKLKEKPESIKRKFPKDGNAKEPKSKKMKKKLTSKEDKAFSKLVDQYRSKIGSKFADNAAKSRWFEDS